MPLSPNLTISTVTGTGSEFTIVDSTVYGGANPARDTLAVYLTAFKVDEDEVESQLTVVFTPTSPETASSFTVTAFVGDDGHIQDGWYKFKFAIVPRWLIGTVFNENDLTWSELQQGWYRYINITPSSGNPVTDITRWAPISDPTAYIPDDVGEVAPANISYQVLETVTTYQTSICFIKAAAKHAKDSCATGDCGCNSKIGKLFHKIETLFTNMDINNSTQDYLEGEKNAREVQKYCSDCGCLDR